jgi:hypothetical protein
MNGTAAVDVQHAGGGGEMEGRENEITAQG